MAKESKCSCSVLLCCTEYETSRTLIVRNKTVGVTNRLIQAIIIGYVIGYVCVVQKAYQDTDSVISSVTTKVKGFAKTNSSDLGLRVWDTADYIIPPQEENSFFVLTNMIVTPNQMQTRCPEVRAADALRIQTGKCVDYSDAVKTCEVFAWCPLEKDTDLPEPAMLTDAETFTVLIKNNIRFPKFHFSKRNILPDVTSSYLKSCTFHRITDPHCPIFQLKDIVSEADEDFQDLAIRGGVIGILINWDCDLDLSHKKCIPKYSFSRLDNKNPENSAAPGFNFRFAKYFSVDGVETRTLVKAYGIRFDVIVFGKVNAVSDWVLLTFTSKRHFYSQQKSTYLDEMDDTSEVGLCLVHFLLPWIPVIVSHVRSQKS
uniref:P2X purinoceptor n=1 Tax=Scleropages formosus TaxID=113540 RepID=A0A8C9V140_SCLFO